MSSNAPSPRITSPSPSTQVPAGQNLTVTFETNNDTLPHEVILLDENFNVLASVKNINASTTTTASLAIPAGASKTYYIAVGVDPASTTEQKRHIIKVTTP